MNENRISNICAKVEAEERINEEEALSLLQEEDFLVLGQLAQKRQLKFHSKDKVSFCIDRNINYTNICESKCRFCAFYRAKDDPEAYLLNADDIVKRVQEAVLLGATQIMLQGGLNPDLKIEYYEDILRKIKDRFNVFIHSFSPPEIWHISNISGVPIKKVLIRLRDAGLDSLPGAGAEMLIDRVRAEISPKKINTKKWLAVMETAHGVGLESTATMMMGSIETIVERIEHLKKIRDLQDRTGGFRSFIPWTFTSGNTELGGKELSSIEYLRTLAVSRIYLDNVKNIQGSWVTQGKDIGQISLFFGANDLGSIMLEENVVKAAGTENRITEDEMVDLIKGAGKNPVQRNTEYCVVKTY
jgi:cyclic dehypoxanthinyl futalosine synthase